MSPSNIRLSYTAVADGVSEGEALGITADEIKNLVNAFYAKVQNDEILGPVFEQEMTEDWDRHLEKMSNFWTTVMFGVPLYKGNPVAAHQKIPTISKDHFDHWLALFRQTLEEVCPNNEHVDAFYRRATNMARVMTQAIGYRPASLSIVPSGTKTGLDLQ
jgi:hemoglobin